MLFSRPLSMVPGVEQRLKNLIESVRGLPDLKTILTLPPHVAEWTAE
jgi:hypothetical protein